MSLHADRIETVNSITIKRIRFGVTCNELVHMNIIL